MIQCMFLFDAINGNLIVSTKSGILENYHFSKMCKNLLRFAPEGLKPRLAVRLEFEDHVSVMTLSEFVSINDL